MNLSCGQNFLAYDDKSATKEANGAAMEMSGVLGKAAGVSGIPDEEFTLQRIVNNRPELEHFRTFLAENFAGEDLNCWLDIEALRRVPDRLRAVSYTHLTLPTILRV